MIDINELRRLAQAATPGPDGVSLSWIRLLRDFQQGASPAAISELLDRLEATEEDRSRFLVEIGRLCAQCDALRAKIAEMERQEPVACKNCNGMGDRFDQSGEKIPCDLCESHLEEIRSLVAEAAHDIISGSDFWLSISLAAKKIYALPGAKTQPAPSVPTVAAAAAMGARGGPALDGERLAFEAWVLGHGWSLCARWNGEGYVGDLEQGGAVCPHAMRTRMIWAAWRDRAALAHLPMLD